MNKCQSLCYYISEEQLCTTLKWEQIRHIIKMKYSPQYTMVRRQWRYYHSWVLFCIYSYIVFLVSWLIGYYLLSIEQSFRISVYQNYIEWKRDMPTATSTVACHYYRSTATTTLDCHWDRIELSKDSCLS